MNESRWRSSSKTSVSFQPQDFPLSTLLSSHANALSMILGFKGIPHNLMYLANDDVDTPTAMVGKKMVPILELGRQGHDDHEVRVEVGGGGAGLGPLLYYVKIYTLKHNHLL